MDDHAYKQATIILLRPNDSKPIQEIRYALFEAESKIKAIKQEKMYWSSVAPELETYRMDRIYEKKSELEKQLTEEKESRRNGNTKKIIITVDIEKQIVRVGDYSFENFDAIFSLFKRKDKISINKKSQLKWGLALLYAMARYTEVNSEIEHIKISELLPHCHGFRRVLGDRNFSARWRKKTGISQSDVESANSILSKCSIDSRFRKSKDQTEILIARK
jgi:hypothetical protein